MRLSTRTWFCLSIFFFIAAGLFWWQGQRYRARQESQRATNAPAVDPGSNAPAPGASAPAFPLLTTPESFRQAAAARAAQNATAPQPRQASIPPDPRFPHRLRNTLDSVNELAGRDTAILLRNALIDTARDTRLPIPEHLRSNGDPGAFIVQARGRITPHFRETLTDAGADIVSYIPNDAYLVRATPDAADRLKTALEVRAVLPYEPYFKIGDDQLLAQAVAQEPAPADALLWITGYGDGEQLRQDLATAGAEILSEDRSPFGPQLLVRPPDGDVAPIARLASVQTLERHASRELMSDRTRISLGIVTNSSTPVNYLGLSGSNVLVNVNDSGIEATHPDLQGRVFSNDPDALRDLQGHGTHVAGILGGSGQMSATVTEIPPGSDTNANFRGVAPGVRMFALPLEHNPKVHNPLSDRYFIETAALTNVTVANRPDAPMISNNSWGYPTVNDYNSSAARFDAAVRDALPGMSGSQPMLYVFSAGNRGEGIDAGSGGVPNTISSPATAKNVITVTALENFRSITNVYFTDTNGNVIEFPGPDEVVITNTPFIGLTDTDEEVASFASRGNVGIGIEGDYGRFKPDLIAPGTFVIGPRARNWELASLVDPESPVGEILEELNEPLAPWYRYDSGTSQATPAVSGLLALMQEFFEQTLPANLRRTNSPALMKALLINAARSVGPLYDLQVNNTINFQGWGFVTITNVLPEMMATEPESAWPIQFFDQSPETAVATGETRTWDLTLSEDAELFPLRITLVWTDPPGNPGAGIKLVNDLDLVVSNKVTGEIFYGNNIPSGSDFTPPSTTNSPPVHDFVNNVENVIIRQPFGINFAVNVVGRRVNVNSVAEYHQATSDLNDIVQDFALVISSSELSLTNALQITPVAAPIEIPAPEPIALTNGLALLTQRVGANPSLVPGTNGLAEQWRFYTFTNIFLTNNTDLASITNGTNVAFVTFLPPNLSIPRTFEADIDLYVSSDPGLLTLDAAAIASAFKSATRGGTEAVVFTNAAIGQVFYIGVKAEDQQAAEFGLMSISTDRPFEEDVNGAKIIYGYPARATIPDGSASDPGGVQVIGIGLTPQLVQRVVVTNVIVHEQVGDLIGILSHHQASAVLNNHTAIDSIFGPTNVFIYDDSGFGDIFGSRPTDGPGSLNNFVGLPNNGVWLLNMIDNSPGHLGRVENLILRVDPLPAEDDLLLAGPEGVRLTIDPGGSICYFLDVPPAATNLTIRFSEMTGPIRALIRRELIPTETEADKNQEIIPPGGDLVFGIGDEPNPLEPGRYFLCLINEDTSEPVTFVVAALLDFDLDLDFARTLTETNAVTVLDDGTIISAVHVPTDKRLTEVEVGVRLDHPRVSDLVMHLVSPQGTRIVLAENRGGQSPFGFGSGYGTNLSYTVFTENTNQFTNLNLIKFASPPFGGSLADASFADGFETLGQGGYGTNATIAPWSVQSGAVTVHGVTNELGVVAFEGSNFLELSTNGVAGTLAASIPTNPGGQYAVRFWFRRHPDASTAVQSITVDLGGANARIASTRTDEWQEAIFLFPASGSNSVLRLAAASTPGALIDDVEVVEFVAGGPEYLQPDESLELLEGEQASGEWRLEIRDTRAGPVTDLPAQLISWELDLEYTAPNQPAVFLTNGIVHSGIVLTNQTNFFVVEVCESASLAFVTLTGPLDQLQLIADRSGFPSGDGLRDDYAPIINEVRAGELGVATFLITTNTTHPAPLIPGQPFFLGVHHVENAIESTNAFQIQVVFDRDTCRGDRPIIPLEHDVPYTNAITPSGILSDHYVYRVSNCDATNAFFELVPENGDLSLLLRYELPVPDEENFHYRSDQLGITNELITVSTNSEPVPLAPGLWYLTVMNSETNPVVYHVRAREQSETATNFFNLTNAIPLTMTVEVCPLVTNYFVFNMPETGPGITFDLTGVSAPADLLVGFADPPTLTNALAAGSASPTQDLRLIVRSGTNLPSLTGDWYLRVRSTDPLVSNLTFTVLAEIGIKEDPTTNCIIDPSISFEGTNLCLTWASRPGFVYHVQGRTNVADPTWVNVGPPITAQTTSTRTCFPLATLPYQFFQIVELCEPVEPPGEDEVVDSELVISPDQICIFWTSEPGAIYRVEARTNIVGENWTILDRSPATNTTSSYCIPRSTGYQFFQIVREGSEEPPPTGEEEFITPGLDIRPDDLCLDWLAVIGARYRVEARTNIAGEDWTVITNLVAAATNMSFCFGERPEFRFFQIVREGVQPPPTGEERFITPMLAIGTNGICLTWESLPGLNYRVEGRTNIIDEPWTVVTNLVAAPGATNMTYCFDGFPGFQFFQIVEITDPEPPPPSGEGRYLDPVATVGTNTICLEWPTVPGRTYRLEASTNIVGGTWTTVHTVTATGTNAQHCVPIPTGLIFFQVFEEGTGEEPPPEEPEIIEIEPGTVSTNTIPENGVHYYVAVIDPTVTAINMALLPRDGDLDLYVRRGLPLPGPNSADYPSERGPGLFEQVRVQLDTEPVPASGGAWYIAVVNRSTNDVPYSLRVLQTLAQPGMHIVVPLTNNAPLDYVIAPGSQPTNHFRLTLFEPQPALRFEILDASGDGEMRVALNEFPTTENLTASNVISAGTPSFIQINTNAARTNLVGDWFLTVINTGTNDLTFRVIGSYGTNLPPVSPEPTRILDPELAIDANEICLSWESVPGRNYRLEGRTNIVQGPWTTIIQLSATETNTSHCMPLDSGFVFFQVIEEGADEEPPPASEEPAIAAPTLTTNGQFSLTVVAEPGARYELQWATNIIPPPPVVWNTLTGVVASSSALTLTDPEPATNHPARFYRIIRLEP